LLRRRSEVLLESYSWERGYVAGYGTVTAALSLAFDVISPVSIFRAEETQAQNWKTSFTLLSVHIYVLVKTIVPSPVTGCG